METALFYPGRVSARPPNPGVVAAGHDAACQAAAGVLAAGGNACDAAIAAGFASAVCEPALTSLGGGGFLLSRRRDGRAVCYDFFVDTPGRGRAPAEREPHFLPVTVRFPGADQVFHCGVGSIAVPGAIAGFLHVHRREGRMPLREVVAPAIALARDGVVLNADQAYFLELLRPIMTRTDHGRAIFAPHGALLGAGERLVNRDLADSLAGLPQSAHDFYAGELCQRMARDMDEGGGLVTAADLAAFRVQERAPLEGAYRGGTLLTNPPPAFGGTLLALSLALLGREPPAAGGPESVEHLLTLVAVMQEVERRRATGPVFSRGTTHVSVCDGDGNAASMTMSNGEGSGYVAPGTGIMLNNMLGEDDLHPEGFHAAPPGERVASMMSPSLLLDARGRLRLVLGSGGSKRIRTAMLQVLSLVADFGRPVAAAVQHPRIHWDGDCVQVEPGLPEASVAALAERGSVNRWSQRNLYFGGVNAVAPGGEGAGDPRRGGASRVVAAARRGSRPDRASPADSIRSQRSEGER
jgi:gamma-glutamyltranspeptidase/glutathione hydrolase